MNDNVGSYTWGFISGRDRNGGGHKGLGKTSESIFRMFWCTKQSSGVWGSPGESSYENLVLELAKII